MFISDNTHLFNKFFKTTYLATFFYIGIYTYLFLLTPYLTSIGWSDFHKGLFFTIFSAVGIIAAPVVGSLSDTFGRFKVILAGLIIEVLAITGYIYITQPALLLIIRLLSAIAFNAVVISSMSRIQDVSDDNHRSSNMGIYSSLLSIATISTPLLGGFIADTYGYTAVFQVAQVIMISILVCLLIYDYVLFPGQNYKAAQRNHATFRWNDLNPLKHVRVLFQHPALRSIGLLGMFVNASVPLFTLLIPYLAIDVYGFSNTELTLIMMFRGLALLFQFELGKIPVKIGKVWGITTGIIIRGLALLILFYATDFNAFALGLFVMGIGGGLWNLSAISFMSDIAEKKNIEGEVMGSYQGLSRFTITLSFFLTGIVLSLWKEYIILVYALLYLLGVLLFVPVLFKTQVSSSK